MRVTPEMPGKGLGDNLLVTELWSGQSGAVTPSQCLTRDRQSSQSSALPDVLSRHRETNNTGPVSHLR